MTTALITGASSGIGMEMARILAQRRTDLVLVARREEVLQELKAELAQRNGVRVRVMALDLADRAAVDGVFPSLQADGIDVDYLINNAGFGTHGWFQEADPERLQAMIDVNITALTRLTRHALPGMLQRGRGRILNVASNAAFQPAALMSVYAATKAYVLHFSEALAVELKGTGIKVTALCPGPTASAFFTVADMDDAFLVKIFKPAEVRGVAEYGLAAMMAGRSVAVHGRLNRLMAFGTRFAPRRFVAWLAYRLMKG
ncbi:MAG: SDR family oxidoreductase [Desulfobacteraceae bacterium]|jgi:short-subunit dehydrogenase|nr:SDR family oxidoreductase [Desulfobacteraceae bacterium]